MGGVKRKKKREGGVLGASGLELGLDWQHPIREGRMYRISSLGVGLPMFDPALPGWGGMEGPMAKARLNPGDTFLTVEQVIIGAVPTDEIWLVLCKGVLGKVLLSEWALREVIEVPE